MYQDIGPLRATFSISGGENLLTYSITAGRAASGSDEALLRQETFSVVLSWVHTPWPLA